MKANLLSCLTIMAGLWAGAAPAATTFSCEYSGGGVDRLSRGFYIENYPGSTIDTVTLQYDARDTGTYNIDLTVRESTYGGSVVATASGSVELTGGGGAEKLTFDLGNATVSPGSTLTFEQSLSSGPTSLIFYDTGASACADITQTDGTSPPLDTFRGPSVGIHVTGDLAGTTAVPALSAGLLALLAGLLGVFGVRYRSLFHGE